MIKNIVNPYKSVLLTGGSGRLGSKIRLSKKIPNLLAPPREILDITKQCSITAFFEQNKMDAIIHCAALARMSECEANPSEAIQTNVIGTGNLIDQVIQLENKSHKKVRFIHISTDGVYASTSGNYKENDATSPYNIYGWSKLGAECTVNCLSNFCIIRTRFFDPSNIPFKKSASDLFTSSMPIEDLVDAIIKILSIDLVGIINIGFPRKSDYELYKPFKPLLKPCLREDIVRTLPFQIAHDASMNCQLWDGIKRN